MSHMPSSPNRYATGPAYVAAQTDTGVRQAYCMFVVPLHPATLCAGDAEWYIVLQTDSPNRVCSRRQESWKQWLPYATIIAATSIVLACCQFLELSAQAHAMLNAATAMLLALVLSAVLLLTHQTVESWVRQRILASTPPWEVVIVEERTALASSDAPRCVAVPGAQLACVAWRLQVRMLHLT